MRVLSYETRWEQDTARGVCFMCQLIRPNIRRRHRRPWCDSYNRRHTVRNNGDFLVPKTAGPGCTRYVCVCVRACFKSPPHPSQGGMGRYTPPMAGSLHPTGPGTFGGEKNPERSTHSRIGILDGSSVTGTLCPTQPQPVQITYGVPHALSPTVGAGWGWAVCGLVFWPSCAAYEAALLGDNHIPLLSVLGENGDHGGHGSQS
jgi:hypothetical protein